LSLKPFGFRLFLFFLQLFERKRKNGLSHKKTKVLRKVLRKPFFLTFSAVWRGCFSRAASGKKSRILIEKKERSRSQGVSVRIAVCAHRLLSKKPGKESIKPFFHGF
jgi:hypothetical protein